MMTDKQLAKLRAELSALDDEGLRKYAEAKGVDLSAATTRELAETLIERDAVHKAEQAAAAKPEKQPVKAGGNAKTGRRAMGDVLNDDQIAAVQKVWAWFSRNVPIAAQSAGVWELGKDEREEAADHGVPDGDFRVLGADWILTFRKGRFVQAVKASATTRADSYSNVPVHPDKL